MEAMTIFHMPVFAKAKELVEQGAIGKLKMIQVNFGSCTIYELTQQIWIQPGFGLQIIVVHNRNVKKTAACRMKSWKPSSAPR